MLIYVTKGPGGPLGGHRIESNAEGRDVKGKGKVQEGSISKGAKIQPVKTTKHRHGRNDRLEETLRQKNLLLG